MPRYIDAEKIKFDLSGLAYILPTDMHKIGEYFMRQLREMSVEDVRPVIKGKWIHQTKFGRIECDNCGKVYRNVFCPKNFCPNCGSYNGG